LKPSVPEPELTDFDTDGNSVTCVIHFRFHNGGLLTLSLLQEVIGFVFSGQNLYRQQDDTEPKRQLVSLGQAFPNHPDRQNRQ
jgi:hypothetical protein